GFVARFQAQAAVAAYASATLALSASEFRRLVRENTEWPLEGLLEIFVDEVEVSAGVWGRASFAAEVFGEAVLAGSLLPTAAHGPGFSFSFRYGAGWGFGAGYQFV